MKDNEKVQYLDTGCVSLESINDGHVGSVRWEILVWGEGVDSSRYTSAGLPRR
jgi:hypothetical protein